MADTQQLYTRRQTTAQQADRRYGELLQELRVTQTGVQVLLGFLFTVVFSNRFKELTGHQQDIYLTTLILGASATAVLIAPVSFHRFLFGRRMKPELVRAANRLTLLGLGLLMCTIAAATLLVFRRHAARFGGRVAGSGHHGMVRAVVVSGTPLAARTPHGRVGGD
jgi:Family of unknown function (DUF6328)